MHFTDADTLPTKRSRDGTYTEWCDSETGKPLAFEYADCWTLHSSVLHCLGKKHIHTFNKQEFEELVAHGGGSLRGAIAYRALHTTCRVSGVVGSFAGKPWPPRNVDVVNVDEEA